MFYAFFSIFFRIESNETTMHIASVLNPSAEEAAPTTVALITAPISVPYGAPSI